MEHGILKTVKRIFEETLSNIGFGKEARAQSVPDNIQTLINTHACVGCNLTGANLIGANLSDASLIGAVLFEAVLSGANLTGATWCHGHWICWACSIGTCIGGDRIDTCKGS